MNNKILVKEAIKIGNELLLATQKTQNGWFWKTLNVDIYQETSKWGVNETLYSGTGGIVYFFLSLYNYTNKKEYLEAVEKGTRWILWYCKKNPTNNYAFYTGRMGVVYLLIKCFEITNEFKYLESALNIAKSSQKFLTKKNLSHDLLRGTSGSILGLLHLFEVSQEKWILSYISNFVEQLINNIKLNSKGVYWDFIPEATKSLCGFAHGSAGIAFTLIELGKYFNNNSFYSLAMKAIEYENFHYSQKNKNWPDFRKLIIDQSSYKKTVNAYHSNDSNYFEIPNFMTAWCHGATGIGFSRVRAYKSLKHESIKEDIIRSIEASSEYINKNLKKENVTYTLCHGLSAHALFFSYIQQQLIDINHPNLQQRIAKKCIQTHKYHLKYKSGYSKSSKIIEDTSLFMGKAGIGYFYLNCSDLIEDPLILAPHINANPKKKPFQISSASDILQISKKSLNKKIIEQIYPRTTFVLSTKYENLYDSMICHSKKLNIKYFGEKIKGFENLIDKNTLYRIKDIYSLEQFKAENMMSLNPFFLDFQSHIQHKKNKEILELNIEKLLKKKIVLNNTILIYHTKWNWSLVNPHKWLDNFESSPNNFSNVLIKDITTITEKNNISKLSNTILKLFKEPKSINQAISEIAEKTNINSKIKNAILKQISSFLKENILIRSG